MADGVKVFGRSRQLSLNKFFDPSTPSMINADDGEKRKKRKYQPSGAGGTRSPPATPHRLQHLTACFIQNRHQDLERG